MVDFKDAFKKGLAANADAEAARREIQDIVNNLSREVGEATDGVLAVDLVQGTRQKVREFAGTLAALTGPEVTRVKYTSLVAKRAVEPSTTQELCDIEIPPTGYPVFLAWEGQQEHSYDRASLEVALNKLLAHPDTGRRLQRLLDMPTPAK